MLATWLVAVSSCVAAGAAVWTVFQQRQLNKHERQLNALEEKHADS